MRKDAEAQAAAARVAHQISNLTVVSFTVTVCVRKAAPMVDSCRVESQNCECTWRLTCVAARGATRLEIEELAFHKPQHEARLAGAHVAEQDLREEAPRFSPRRCCAAGSNARP